MFDVMLREFELDVHSFPMITLSGIITLSEAANALSLPYASTTTDMPYRILEVIVDNQFYYGGVYFP